MHQFSQEPAGACDQFAALLSVWERVLGHGHLATLATRGSLAYRTGQAESDTGRQAWISFRIFTGAWPMRSGKPTSST